MSDLSILIGDKIKRQRKKLGMNQEKLALNADIDRSYMGRIERGEVSITVEKLFQIARVLSCELSELVPTLMELENFSQYSSH